MSKRVQVLIDDPTGDIDCMNEEIERGYLDSSRR